MNHTWPTKTPTSILVRMPNWLGDLVMATPILADLRQHFPRAKLTAMCQSNVAPLLREDPHLDELFSFQRPSGWLHRQEFRNILMPLRHGQYDLGILLTVSFSSGWKFWRGWVKNRMGFSNGARDLLLNRSVSWPKNSESQHLVLTYKELLKPLGIAPSNTAPKLYLSTHEKKGIREILHSLKIPSESKLIGINPGAAYGTAKCWPPSRFEAVGRELLQDPKHHLIFFGDSASIPLLDSICNKLPDRAVNLAGKTTLRELMGLIAECDAFLTNDSGPMHIASALGTPLVALFGSTNAVKTGPYSGGKVIQAKASCSPCYMRVCPIDFRCMKRIEVDRVVQAMREILN